MANTNPRKLSQVGFWVTRNWAAVIIAWLLLALALEWLAPKWDDVASDGDLAFLPKSVPSAQGQLALEKAFPSSTARSQLAIVLATSNELGPGDFMLGLDLIRRLHWFAGKSTWEQYQGLSDEADSPMDLRPQFLLDTAYENLSAAIEAEETLAKLLLREQPNRPLSRLPDCFEIRAQIHRLQGDEEAASVDAAKAKFLAEKYPLLPLTPPEWSACFQDVWTWRTPVLAHKLGSELPNARLISIQLNAEFTAVRNLRMVRGVEEVIADLRRDHSAALSPDLQVKITGSAAIGADMLRAASSGIRKTEIITIFLVLIILIVVYRAPMLVAIPLISIGLSFFVATNVIALLAIEPTSTSVLGLRVFTTTKIFIVVLLFGAGTDFCLFFLARVRELLDAGTESKTRRDFQRLAAQAWASVSLALIASALTTIVGLALMWFSDFQKFQYSGPIIAVSLGVTLCVCLTFTPALLCAVGSVAFWPRLRRHAGSSTLGSVENPTQARESVYWRKLAQVVTERPTFALACALLLFAFPTYYGFLCLGQVTYDLPDELSESAPSRQGAVVVERYFAARDGSPITVLVNRPTEFASEEELQAACDRLTRVLYVSGVEAVRSLTDPLGDYPPGKAMGLFDQDAWRRRILRNRITREQYISPAPSLTQRVAKFDVLLTANPFSAEASQTLRRLQQAINQEVTQASSVWSNASISYSGTTVGITDLRNVTQTDQTRIQILVTLGVWCVLLVLLRHLVLATYLIFTVLLSYFTTLGLTYAFFHAVFGPDYTGLDWKVPLFLFVILVAVGQDYNVYLVTRIFEERKRLPIKDAVQQAVVKTGGIITSCGFVMAGTFVAMTSPAVLHWLADLGWTTVWDATAPVLRGITELGFALALGVLLDTLIVRSILVPAFVVLRYERASRGPA